MSNMKFILCLVALTACVALVQAVPELYKKIVQGCYAELTSPIDDDIREKLNRHEVVEFTPEVRAFISCLNKKVDAMYPNEGNIPDRVRAILKSVITDKAQLDAMVKKCTEDKGTPEETMYYSWKCAADYTEEHSPGTLFRFGI